MVARGSHRRGRRVGRRPLPGRGRGSRRRTSGSPPPRPIPGPITWDPSLQPNNRPQVKKHLSETHRFKKGEAVASFHIQSVNEKKLAPTMEQQTPVIHLPNSTATRSVRPPQWPRGLLGSADSHPPCALRTPRGPSDPRPLRQEAAAPLRRMASS